MPEPDVVTESSPAVYVVVHDGVISFVSSASIAVSGLPPEYFVGRHILDVVHASDRESLAPLLAPEFRGRFALEVRVPQADGTWGWRVARGVRTSDGASRNTAVLTLTRASHATAG